MTKPRFWQGIGLGVLAGAALGFKMKAEEKTIKRSANKAMRNMENLFDSIGH